MQQHCFNVEKCTECYACMMLGLISFYVCQTVNFQAVIKNAHIKYSKWSINVNKGVYLHVNAS